VRQQRGGVASAEPPRSHALEAQWVRCANREQERPPTCVSWSCCCCCIAAASSCGSAAMPRMPATASLNVRGSCASWLVAAWCCASYACSIRQQNLVQ
jgi:hypothetical protein